MVSRHCGEIKYFGEIFTRLIPIPEINSNNFIGSYIKYRNIGKIDTKSISHFIAPILNSLTVYYKKRYSIIDQHLARHFKNNSAGLLSPPPFLCSQIITPFSHFMLSANQEKGCASS